MVDFGCCSTNRWCKASKSVQDVICTIGFWWNSRDGVLNGGDSDLSHQR